MADTRIQKKMKQGRHVSAQKRARQALKHRTRNRRAIATMRTAIKSVRNAVIAKNKETAKSALKSAVSIIAKTASRGIIHSCTAARYSSRLSLAVNRLGA